MHMLLNEGKSIVGLLFNVPLNQDHPPFGGNKEEYLGFNQNHLFIIAESEGLTTNQQ